MFLCFSKLDSHSYYVNTFAKLAEAYVFHHLSFSQSNMAVKYACVKLHLFRVAFTCILKIRHIRQVLSEKYLCQHLLTLVVACFHQLKCQIAFVGSWNV